tara:strand:- start:399 stop:1130 length:732 start_codon:yes stop_codon:yes gene_type:complete
MAISVDTIYQRVLALANKEQRGYITPQEFNLLANQAQMGIFEGYFYAKNQRDRAETDRTGEVDETDIGELLGAKLSPFRRVQAVTSGHTFLGVGTIDGVERDVFQTGRVFLGNDVCHKLSLNEVSRILRSKRHIATTENQFPIYTDNPADAKDILVYAGSTTAETTITAEYFLVPKVANWTYVVVNSKALFNSTLAVDFELHRSEEDTLVYDILALAGIVMNKPGLAQTASQIGVGEQQLQNV